MEGWDAIQATTYRKEDPSRRGIEKSGERERERNKETKRESDHCVSEDCVLKEPSLLD